MKLALLILTVWLFCPRVGFAEEFHLSTRWVHGVCLNCKTANQLASVQFVSKSEAWAIGFLPPGQTGAGDYSILHSRDGGHTWRELPHQWIHNQSPSLSFAGPREGWTLISDISTDQTATLAQTLDGGARWRRLSPPNSDWLDAIQYLGGGAGLAASYDIYAKQGQLAATSDGGRTWRISPLPDGFDTQLMAFASPTLGLIAGDKDGAFALYRTVDGGRHWASIRIDLPSELVTTDHAFEPDDLSLEADGRGTLLINKRSFALGDTKGFAAAWQATDSGATWRLLLEVSQNTPLDHMAFLTGARWLGDYVVVTGNLGDKPGGFIDHSANDGRSWSRLPINRAVGACLRFETSLTCAASGPGFRFLVVSPAFSSAPGRPACSWRSRASSRAAWRPLPRSGARRRGGGWR